MLASAERAIGDRLYLRGESYFDNLSKVDKEKLLVVSTLYQTKAVKKRIEKIIKTL